MTEFARGGFVAGKAEHLWGGPHETVIPKAELLRIGYPQSVIDEMSKIKAVETGDEEADK